MNEKTIFLAAVEIADPAQRAAYLAGACKGDAKLRQQVDALLAAHDRSGEFLDVPALQQMAGVDTGEQAGADVEVSFLRPSTTPGSLGRLGSYDIRELLGRGDCGIVFKAFDDRLNRPVAIKVLSPELAATSPARKRFVREAQAAAAIRHENVVAIHDVGKEPIPFLVMEYIAGQTLQQHLGLRRARSTRRRSSGSAGRSRSACRPPTRSAWCTATSSRATSWWKRGRNE